MESCASQSGHRVKNHAPRWLGGRLYRRGDGGGWHVGSRLGRGLLAGALWVFLWLIGQCDQVVHHVALACGQRQVQWSHTHVHQGQASASTHQVTKHLPGTGQRGGTTRWHGSELVPMQLCLRSFVRGYATCMRLPLLHSSPRKSGETRGLAQSRTLRFCLDDACHKTLTGCYCTPHLVGLAPRAEPSAL